jgi:Protein of unknown function (DUF1449)
MELLLSDKTIWFTAAGGLLILLALIEAALLLGAGWSAGSALDSWFELDADADAAGALAWLHVGRVPLLVLLCLFLTGFALSGYALQLAAQAVLGSFVSAWWAVPAAFTAGCATVRFAGGPIASVLRAGNRNVSSQSFLGRPAVIVTGEARHDFPAQARLLDAHGAAHYVMVTPAAAGERFIEGDTVVIEKPHAQGAGFVASRSVIT